MPDENKPRSLVKKLAEVMAAVSHVPKTGHNNFHNYDYATEADVLAAVRQELAKRSLMIVPSVESCDFTEATTNAGKKELRCTMKMRFTVMDGESGETLDLCSVGQGQDASDKAAYKAATGATKYGVLKLFLIPMGDDPEADSKPAPAQKSAPKTPSPSKPATPKPLDISKLVDAFQGLGVTVAALEERLGHPLGLVTEAEVADLKLYWKKKKELANVDPDEAARAEVKRQAEAAMAAETAKARAAIDAQMKALEGPAKPDAVARVKLFEDFVNRIRAAATPPECVQLSATIAQSGLPPSDLKILERQANDRRLVLADAISQAALRAKTRRLPIEDVPA